MHLDELEAFVKENEIPGELCYTVLQYLGVKVMNCPEMRLKFLQDPSDFVFENHFSILLNCALFNVSFSLCSHRFSLPLETETCAQRYRCNTKICRHFSTSCV